MSIQTLFFNKLPTYSIAPNQSSIDEGASLTFTVTTTNYGSGTLYWTINGASSADFSAYSGSVNVINDLGTFTITTVNDVTTEGNETFSVDLRITSISGNIVASSSSVTINDTSQAPSAPTVIGEAWGGGFYAGSYSTTQNNVTTHYLIVAPKASGQIASQRWKTTLTTTSGTTSLINGNTNQSSMSSSTHPAAGFCRGLTIGGYSDWYLPAKWELDVCYYNLKYANPPNNLVGSFAGYTFGVNPCSIPKRNSGWSTTVPGQTTATDFKSGNAEAYLTNSYWTSTEYSADSAYVQSMAQGSATSSFKTSINLTTRAIRRIAV